MKCFVQIIMIISIFFTITVNSYSQSEEDFDNEFLSENSNESIENEIEDSDTPRWDFFGFFENNNHFSITENKNDEYEVIKLEARAKLNARYGNDKIYAKASLDTYYYPEDHEDNKPHENGKIEAQELYVGGGDIFQFKLGKQLFQWGTADAFTVTNYMDQPDRREQFATDKDDRFRGVTALSLKILFGEFALEGAVTPVHNKPLLAEGFWEFSPDPIDMGSNQLDMQINDTSAKDSNLKNASYAARFGGTLGILDFHFMYFNGINNNIIFEPVITRDNTSTTPFVNLKPYYDRIQSFGIDMAFNIEKLSVRAEGSYTNNMPGIIKPEVSGYQSAFTSATAGTNGDYQVTEIENAKYFAYVVGADYNLWGDNGRLLVEWMHAKYIDNEKYNAPIFNKLLLIRIEDKFYNEQIYTELNSTLRPIKKETGGYIFQGNDDDLFSLVEDKDLIYIKGRMEF